MFLWATSSAADYDSNGFVFESPLFFDVSPKKGDVRDLIPNGEGELHSFALRSRKTDELIDETGQAGGGDVLISQNSGASKANSLVYYGIHVNNVYAYFAAGVKAKIFRPSPKNPKHPNIHFPDAFPVEENELDQIIAYAKSNGAELQDAEALTMELKTSWVNAATVANPDEYLIINAVVPNYNTTSDVKWTLIAEEPLVRMRLALVGMHVIGTVQGHPEMVWATYEHINNAPDDKYYYADADGSIKSAGHKNNGNWLFMSKNGNFDKTNEPRAMDCSTKKPVNGCVAGDIVNKPDKTIGASDTLRLNPWGNAGSLQTPDVVGNNAQLISLNNDIRKYLDGDVRKNYILRGAVWTAIGGIPTYDDSAPDPKPVQKGSLNLANATMETYHQVVGFGGCFACHSIGKGNPGTDVSHIFGAILKSDPIIPR